MLARSLCARPSLLAWPLIALALVGCGGKASDPHEAEGRGDPLRACRHGQKRSPGGGVTLRWECEGGVLALAQGVAQPLTDKLVSDAFSGFEREMKPNFGEREESPLLVDGKPYRSMRLIGLLPGGESLEVRQVVAAGSEANTSDLFTCVAPSSRASVCQSILARLVREPPSAPPP